MRWRWERAGRKLTRNKDVNGMTYLGKGTVSTGADDFSGVVAGISHRRLVQLHTAIAQVVQALDERSRSQESPQELVSHHDRGRGAPRGVEPLDVLHVFSGLEGVAAVESDGVARTGLRVGEGLRLGRPLQSKATWIETIVNAYTVNELVSI